MPTPMNPSPFCSSPAVSGPTFACGHPNAGMRGPNGECMMVVTKPSESDWNAYFEMTYVDPAEFNYEGI